MQGHPSQNSRQVGWKGTKHGIRVKKLMQAGEAEAVDLEIIEEELEETMETVQPYDNDYNMDKSTLFWKMTLDVTLATQQGPRQKHDKARITINLAYNVTGSHKLDPRLDVLVVPQSTSKTFAWSGKTTKKLP